MTRSKPAILVAGAVLSLGLGTATGQEGPGPEPSDTVASIDEGASAGELLEGARTALVDMRHAQVGLERLIEAARADRDVVLVLCLTDKLGQVNAAMRSAEGRLKALQTAVERGLSERMRHEAAMIGVLRDRTVAMESEGDQCVGGEVGFVGEGRLEVRVDPGIPPADSSLFPPDDSVLEPPPLTSPTK